MRRLSTVEVLCCFRVSVENIERSVMAIPENPILPGARS